MEDDIVPCLVAPLKALESIGWTPFDLNPLMDFWCSNVGDLIRGKSDFNTPWTIAKVVSFISRIHLFELRTPL